MHLRFILIISGAILLALFAYWGIKFCLTVQVSKKLIQAVVPYEKESGDASAAMLVLGDSTAVGVGADTPEETVAGRIGEHINATLVENYAVSGAVTADLSEQSRKARLDRYQLIVIQIGGNDIIRFTSEKKAAEQLRVAIAALPAAGKVVIISAGDVGGATLFPLPVRPFHTRLNQKYHDAFAAVAQESGATYVNFGESPATREINARPDIYLAADGLHPSSEGYRLWFEEMRPSL